MRKAVIVLSIIGASLIVLGVAAFVVAMAFGGWLSGGTDMDRYKDNSYDISESFSNISINTKESDIVFIPSTDGTCRVLCHEKERMEHKVAVNGDTLEIKLEDNRKWYQHINFFSFSSPKITVYLPEGEYGSLEVRDSTGNIQVAQSYAFENIDISTSTGDIRNNASAHGLMKIKASTGHITVENISAGAIDITVSTGEIKATSIACVGSVSIKVSTGKTELSDIRCGSLTSTGDTGNISLRNVIADGSFRIERSTGDVKFDRCDAGEIYVKTDTGEVEGSLLSDKVFLANTDTGDIEVPKSINGGRCEITTDTGDIRINIVGK